MRNKEKEIYSATPLCEFIPKIKQMQDGAHGGFVGSATKFMYKGCELCYAHQYGNPRSWVIYFADEEPTSSDIPKPEPGTGKFVLSCREPLTLKKIQEIFDKVPGSLSAQCLELALRYHNPEKE